MLPGTNEAARKQPQSTWHRGGLRRAHLHGPAGSDYRGRGARRSGQLGRKCGRGGPLSFDHVSVWLHLHRPIYQICGMTLLV